MDYQELKKSAEVAGTAKRVSLQRIVLKEKDVVLGMFMGRDLVISKKKGFADSYLYTFDTDTGAVSFFLSGALDAHDGAKLEAGRVYQITYVAKRQISGGRTLKDFEVIDYGAVEGYAELEEDKEV